MAFLPSYLSRYWVGSQRWSVYARSFSATKSRKMFDITSLESTAEEFVPGHQAGAASMSLMLDGSAAATSQFVLQNTWLDTPQPITFSFDPSTLGNDAVLMLGNQSDAQFNSQLNDVQLFDVTVQPDGQVNRGQIVGLESTSITTTTNGTSVNSGAASANGGVAHLHVTAFSGLTSDTVTIEHSTTGSSGWTTLATFTAATGVTSQRVVVAAGTTVNQYLRVVDTVVGTGSCSRVVAFARK